MADTLKNNFTNTEKHYVETSNYSLKDKGYFDISSIVSALPSGATIKSIVATVIGYGGHLYVTGAGQEGNKWYVAYINWTGDATSVSRSVRVDIAYTL